MFEIGQMVVCINDDGQQAFLSRGLIYEVEFPENEFLHLVGIALEEKPKNGFFAWRFRPIRKTDISAIIEALKKLPVDLDKATV